MRISINNGCSFTSPENAIKELGFDVIRQYMDDSVIDKILWFNDIDNDLQLLEAYLKVTKNDLIIG